MEKSKADWIGLQPNDPKPIIYLGNNSPGDVVKLSSAYKFWCLSYAYIRQSKQMVNLVASKKVRCFIDSGAFTLHKNVYTKRAGVDEHRQRAESYLVEYVKWLSKYPQGTFDFYVNLDYVVHCPTIYKMLQRMYRLGVKPIPVYHGDASLDWLKKYVDEGHKLVGIGFSNAVTPGMRRRFYDQVFNFAAKIGNLFYHGFACRYLFDYPWYSVDSTAWTRQAFNGELIDIHPCSVPAHRRIYKFTVSRNGRSGLMDSKELRKRIENRGFVLEELVLDSAKRELYNIQTLKMMSETGTSLGSSRLNWNSLI